MNKKLIGTITLVLMVGLTTTNVNANTKLSDINGHWANKEIQELVSKGYLKGYEDGTFKPDNSITRAEFVRIANNYFGFKNKGNENFSDVNYRDWFYNDVCIAKEAGYISGYEDGTFKPDKTITREEAAKIIISIKNREDVKIDKLNNFIDGHTVSDWAKKYVEGAIEFGYIKGNDEVKINPLSNITRAESVSMLSRVVNEIPVVVIHNPVIELKVGDKWSNDLIKYTATDKETSEPGGLVVGFKGNVDTSKPGEYQVTVSATDLEKGTGSAVCKVIVKESVLESYNPNSEEFKSTVTSQMFALVNQYRLDNGKQNIVQDVSLNSLASSWSRYMADKNFFDHVDENGKAAPDVFPGHTPTTGENIAVTQLILTGHIQQDAQNLSNELFGMWRNSAGHNANMLDMYSNVFGFGMHAIKTEDGVYSIYATQEFSYDWNRPAPE